MRRMFSEKQLASIVAEVLRNNEVLSHITYDEDGISITGNVYANDGALFVTDWDNVRNDNNDTTLQGALDAKQDKPNYMVFIEVDTESGAGLSIFLHAPSNIAQVESFNDLIPYLHIGDFYSFIDTDTPLFKSGLISSIDVENHTFAILPEGLIVGANKDITPTGTINITNIYE